jgi:DnaJ-class molecular chaperone
MKTCPNCLGEGTVALTEYLLEEICWECGGDGEVEDNEF